MMQCSVHFCRDKYDWTIDTANTGDNCHCWEQHLLMMACTNINHTEDDNICEQHCDEKIHGHQGKHNDVVWLGANHCPPIFKISYWLFLWVLALKYLPPMSNDWWQTVLNLTIGHWPEFDKLRRIKWKLKRLI